MVLSIIFLEDKHKIYSIYQYCMSINSFVNTVSVSRYSRPITVTRDRDQQIPAFFFGIRLFNQCLPNAFHECISLLIILYANFICLFLTRSSMLNIPSPPPPPSHSLIFKQHTLLSIWFGLYIVQNKFPNQIKIIHLFSIFLRYPSFQF